VTVRPVRYSERLRRAADPHWSRTIRHPFTDRIADGSVDARAFARYLVQDLAFVNALAGLVAAAALRAPDMATRRPLARFLAALTGGEEAYFERSFAALAVPRRQRSRPVLLTVTRRFRTHLMETAESRRFEDILAVLLAVEWCYLAWARRVSAGLRRKRRPLPKARHLRDWIVLHDNREFAAFIGWMRREMDRRGPALTAAGRRRVARLFVRTMALEASFFDAFRPSRLDGRARPV